MPTFFEFAVCVRVCVRVRIRGSLELFTAVFELVVNVRLALVVGKRSLGEGACWRGRGWAPDAATPTPCFP